MPEINGQNLATVAHVTTLAQRVKSELDTLDGKTFSSAKVEDGKIKFFSSADKTGTALDSIDLPEEIFLDQTQTTFVQNFTFSAATYPGATDPNLAGKPVLVLAVKGDKTTNPTINYSFINLESLIDTYTAGNGISINDHVVAVKIDSAAGNLLSASASGLKAEMKLSGATQGNIAVFDANGAIVDSGFTVATDADVSTAINNIFGGAS